MGDRSNVMLRTKGEQVCFYHHWGGPDLFRSARKAIAHEYRWDDFQYLTAIVFREIVKDFDPELKGIASLGITQELWDNEYPVLVLDVDEQKVWFERYSGKVGTRIGEPITFDEFLTKWPPGWEFGSDEDGTVDADSDEDE